MVLERLNVIFNLILWSVHFLYSVPHKSSVSSWKLKIKKEYFTYTILVERGSYHPPGTLSIIWHVKLLGFIWTDLNMKRGPSVTFIVCFSLSPIITQFILVFHKQFIALKHLLFWANNECWLGLYSIMRPSWSDWSSVQTKPFLLTQQQSAKSSVRGQNYPIMSFNDGIVSEILN